MSVIYVKLCKQKQKQLIDLKMSNIYFDKDVKV